MAKDLAHRLKYLALDFLALGRGFDDQPGIRHGFVTGDRFNARQQCFGFILPHFLFGDQTVQRLCNAGFAFLGLNKI